MLLFKFKKYTCRVCNFKSIFFEFNFQKNTPILIFQSDKNVKLSFEWKSVCFIIIKKDSKIYQCFKLTLIKNKNSICIYIPYNSVQNLEISELKSLLSQKELKKQFELLGPRDLRNVGFVVPLIHLNLTLFYNEYEISESLKINKPVISKVLKAKHVDWTIQYLDDLPKIKEMFSSFVSQINYQFVCRNSTIRK